MQRNLLDTHTFIWFINGDKQLSATAKKLIEADETLNFISIASIWEISIKISLGKLELKTSFDKVSEQIVSNGFEILPITFQDTFIVSSLPFHHRDPFDRIIIAQAISNNIQVITKDKNFRVYDVKLTW